MSEGEIKKIFAKNLTFYLALRGKSQKDLIDFIKVSSSTASNWCTGQKLPRMDKIQSISNWLNIENSDLLENKLALGQHPYQIDHELRDIALFLAENPEYKQIFHALKNIDKEDITRVTSMIDKIKK